MNQNIENDWSTPSVKNSGTELDVVLILPTVEKRIIKNTTHIR